MITFDCPHCRQTLNAEDQKAGARLRCPGCRQPLQVPSQSPATVSPQKEILPEFEPVTDRYTSRRKKKSSSSFFAIAVVLMGLIAVGGYVAVKFQRGKPKLTLPPVNGAVVQELRPVSFELSAVKPAGWSGVVRYSLTQSPAGARIHPQNGSFSWTPTEEQGPGNYSFTLRAEAEDGSAVADEVTFSFTVTENNLPPVIAPLDAIAAKPGEAVEFTIVARDPDIPPVEVTSRIVDGAPPGSVLDGGTGRFQWTPDKQHAGQELAIVFEAKEAGEGLNALEIVHIHVAAVESPSEKLLEELRSAGADVEFVRFDKDVPLSGAAQTVRLNGNEIQLLQYADDQVRLADAEQVMNRAKQSDENSSAPLRHFYQRDRLIVVYQGEDQATQRLLSSKLGAPFASGRITLTSPAKAETAATGNEDPPETDVQKEFDDRLFRMHELNLLLVRKRYSDLRKIYADRFAAAHAVAIAAAFDDDAAAWLSEHEEIREELYTAIDPQADNVSAALETFAALLKQFPDQIEQYANLAIAVAVTWDGSRGGVYEYGRHQRRVHATMPDDLAGAAENFQYFLDSEKVMQGRARFLPWEFLIHLVNHRTPVMERQWALQNYLPQRVGFGKCYGDVPYDNEMLRTGDKVCRMDGKEYTLANLKTYGGVCAQQADFAARVGKSLGVPAVYVNGHSNSGGLHAWVMWVELGRVTEKSIDFELKSHGRYRNDKYYVGNLHDPQSGVKMTDRAMELRLHSLGTDPIAFRHASMVMQAFPLIRERTEMDATQELVFLRKAAELCPSHSAIWTTLAALSRSGVIEKRHSRQMARNLELFFTTFAGYPDFIWTVFEDLLSYQTEAKVRLEQYARAVQAFEAVGRPDLACEARLKLSDLQVENNSTQAAIEGLAYTIKKFPSEGRYVPRLLDRLEQICKNVEGSGPQLVAFYQQFLPMVPTHRGKRPSKYCKAMYQRAIEFFQQQNAAQLAQEYRTRLQQLESSQTSS